MTEHNVYGKTLRIVPLTVLYYYHVVVNNTILERYGTYTS